MDIPTSGSRTPEAPPRPGRKSGRGFTSFGIAGRPALFIFANLNSAISAWLSNINHTTNAATIEWSTPGALYTGLAINQADTMLYAANSAGAGGINVYNSSFVPVSSAPALLQPLLRSARRDSSPSTSMTSAEVCM